VFLNNKLIATDTIVPLMLTIRRRSPRLPIWFYCFERATYDVLQRNVVLREAIAECGPLLCLAGNGKGPAGRIAGKLRKLVALVGLTLLALAHRIHFVHFKALRSGPFRLLARVNQRRSVLFEPNCWGYHKTMIEQVGNIGRQRRRSSTPLLGDHLVGFSADWPELHDPANAARTKLLIGSTHLAADWLDYVDKQSRRHLQPMLENHGAGVAARVVVFILGYFDGFDFTRARGSMLALFEATMDELAELGNEAVVLLKPHAITDRRVVQAAIDRRPLGRFIVTDLHPMVLATRADVFVANYYSTTFADAQALDVATIEYSDYSDATLAVTGGGSMRAENVSVFVNGDRAAFRHALRERLAHAHARERRRPATSDMTPAIELLTR